VFVRSSATICSPNLDEYNQHFEKSGTPGNLTDDEIVEAMA
jgi:hypothetical protein